LKATLCIDIRDYNIWIRNLTPRVYLEANVGMLATTYNLLPNLSPIDQPGVFRALLCMIFYFIHKAFLAISAYGRFWYSTRCHWYRNRFLASDEPTVSYSDVSSDTIRLDIEKRIKKVKYTLVMEFISLLLWEITHSAVCLMKTGAIYSRITIITITTVVLIHLAAHLIQVNFLFNAPREHINFYRVKLMPRGFWEVIVSALSLVCFVPGILLIPDARDFYGEIGVHLAIISYNVVINKDMVFFYPPQRVVVSIFELIYRYNQGADRHVW